MNILFFIFGLLLKSKVGTYGKSIGLTVPERVGVFVDVVPADNAVALFTVKIGIIDDLVTGPETQRFVFPFHTFQEWESQAIRTQLGMIRTVLGKEIAQHEVESAYRPVSECKIILPGIISHVMPEVILIGFIGKGIHRVPEHIGVAAGPFSCMVQVSQGKVTQPSPSFQLK